MHAFRHGRFFRFLVPLFWEMKLSPAAQVGHVHPYFSAYASAELALSVFQRCLYKRRLALALFLSMTSLRGFSICGAIPYPPMKSLGILHKPCFGTS